MSQTVLFLRNVNIYQDKNLILSDINLEINHGEFLYIIGKTGSGKSSLLKTLYADLPLTEGQANVVEFDLATLKEDKIPYLRRKIGIVFQDFKLLPKRTVFENIAFAMEIVGMSNKEIKNTVPKVIDLVGLSGKEKNYPDQLSGGEQQRVAVARALINKPAVIFADEPSGNLDHISAENLHQLFFKLRD